MKKSQKVQPEFKVANTAINFDNVKNAKSIFRAVDHNLRKKILSLIDSTEGGKLNVSSIYKKLKLEQSVVSQHLAILRRANLVTTERKGKEILYAVNTKAFHKLNDFAAKSLDFMPA